MDQTISFSIIIPHHNIPSLLEKCLFSIPERDDIQVIVVDDASDKTYLPELHRVQKMFPNVEFVFCKENGYGGRARNVGLEHAIGEYVIFADADDFFTSGINQILNKLEDDTSDIIYFKTRKIDMDTGLETTQPHYTNAYIDLWEKDKERAELYLRYIWGEPWGKIIKRKMIEDYHVRFDETRINNDTTFSYLIGYYAQSISVDKRELYSYIVRRGSTSRQKDRERLFIKIDVFGRSELFFRQKFIPLHENRHLNALSYFLRTFSFSDFRQGFRQLQNMGFDSKIIRKNYADAVGQRNFIAPIWSILFAPDFKIKLYCVISWFRISWPRFIKYKVLQIKNPEMRIS